MKEATCPISAWACVYHACLSNHCQKRYCYDQLKGRYGEGVCQEKPEARIHAYHSTHKDITFCGKSNQDIMVTPEDLLNSTSDRKCKTCVRLVKMFRKRKVLKMVVAMMLIVSIIGCVKDDEPVSTTVRKVYPVEGRYTGSFFMDNDTIGLHWKFENVLVVCAVDGEQVLIENMKTTAKAWMGAESYYYDPFWLHGQTPCGQAFIAQFRGTGKYGEGWITEVGWFKMVLSGEPIRGNWRSEMVKEEQK